jgi:hypothetical protein
MDWHILMFPSKSHLLILSVIKLSMAPQYLQRSTEHMTHWKNTDSYTRA